MSRVVIIINPVSGRRRRHDVAAERTGLARQALRTHDLEGEVVVTERPGHGRDLARAALNRGASLVCAWGGDGTINEVASALAFGAAPLGVIPSGSGNGLARELRIPADPQHAFAVAFGADERAIDVGEVAGRRFFNVAGIGFDALVAETFNAQGTGRGALPYFVATVRELHRYVAQQYEIAADGADPSTVRALLIAIANGRQFGNGATIAPAARLDDGRLDLVVIDGRPFWGALWSARRLFLGTIDRAQGVTMRQIHEVVVRAEGNLHVHVDGEPFLARAPVVAKVHPAGLRVRVPLSRVASGFSRK